MSRPQTDCQYGGSPLLDPMQVGTAAAFGHNLYEPLPAWDGRYMRAAKAAMAAQNALRMLWLEHRYGKHSGHGLVHVPF